MCGRFTHFYTWRQLYALLNLSNPGATLDEAFGGQSELFAPSYNVAPTQLAPVVRIGGDGKLGPALLKWGLMPAWATKPGPINARAETVAALPMFRSAFAKRRCIVPASGFYEWQKAGEKVKQPWYIQRTDGAPLLFAGLWESRADAETFTIITCAANEFMRAVHDRMPVIVEPESVSGWLAAADAALLRPAADGILTGHKVSTRVNTPKNNDAELVTPV